ncbi:MAG: NAD(+) synthase, partial [Lachnospiraceae bacterium]|nr:NAD(+) synthase [Lachnospiraceae bacterium]
MKDGYIKVAAATPKIVVADVWENVETIKKQIDEAVDGGAKIVVFPELCITGYTCQDLFLQDRLLAGALDGLYELALYTDGLDILVFVGLPFRYRNCLYNVAAALNDGRVIALVPKTHIPNYAEFYEARHFAKGPGRPIPVTLFDEEIPFGTDILFETDALFGMSIAAEICEDVWAPDPPTTRHALAGANVLVNLSASNEIVGKAEYREMLIKSTSARLVAGYVFASAGEGESTQDVVFGGHNLIMENGMVLAASERFSTGVIFADLDIEKLQTERARMNTFGSAGNHLTSDESYAIVPFDIVIEETQLARTFSPTPFVPGERSLRDSRCEEILNIQSHGLKKRLEHVHASTAVLGISGGLDSTLALLVTVRAFDLIGKPHKDILAVTMPCFGTTDRTYDNACKLAKVLGCSMREVDIRASVLQHFADIGQDPDKHDVTYENGQARERTQVLMDIANKENGLVIGTGDLSELALGWATYNGDHMSMYGVNASVPKTLVRHLVKYYADTCANEKLASVLEDVLDTPVSPELLPPKDGVISQKTEDLVGPYELHDFFLYYMLRYGFSPEKIFRIAMYTFEERYTPEVIMKWLKTFYRRFFAQHFKRSCLPDGPKVGSVAVSPRGDLRMPSDASANLWLA